MGDGMGEDTVTKLIRISAENTALKDAIRAITHMEKGEVRSSWQQWVDLAEKAPILRDVLSRRI